MFEAADVLNEVLRAVESGKKQLRLDYTPYRLYDMYKKKLPKAQEPIYEESDEEDVKQKKRDGVRDFMDRASNYIHGQGEDLKKGK
jgi:hypothetical protein